MMRKAMSDLAAGIMGQTAEQLAQTLDDNAATVDSMYIQTTGGGIRGSIISTVYLLLVSMVIALPIGIASAVYLNEYAKKSKFICLLPPAVSKH